MADPNLNPRQQRFIEEFLLDLNATQAAIRAGYSARTANQQATRLLAKVNIQAALQKAMERRSKRVEITQNNVIFEIAKLAWYNVEDFMYIDEDGRQRLKNVEDLGRDKSAAIIGISETRDGTVTLKLADKHAALVSVGKHLGMWPSRVDATIKDATPPLTLKDQADAGKRLAFLLAVAAHEQEKEKVLIDADGAGGATSRFQR